MREARRRDRVSNDETMFSKEKANEERTATCSNQSIENLMLEWTDRERSREQLLNQVALRIRQRKEVGVETKKLEVGTISELRNTKSAENKTISLFSY